MALVWKSTYSWDLGRRDVLAALTVAAISLPQGMAYALIAGVDPRFGLYSAVIVTLVASLLGSSSHLINGPTSAISLSALADLGPWRSVQPQSIGDQCRDHYPGGAAA